MRLKPRDHNFYDAVYPRIIQTRAFIYLNLVTFSYIYLQLITNTYLSLSFSYDEGEARNEELSLNQVGNLRSMTLERSKLGNSLTVIHDDSNFQLSN